MYEMIQIDELPEIRRGRRNCPRVNQLREFLQSKAEFIKLQDIQDKQERRRVYNGLKMAARRPEFKGMALVRRYGETIYLIRQG